MKRCVLLPLLRAQHARLTRQREEAQLDRVVSTRPRAAVCGTAGVAVWVIVCGCGTLLAWLPEGGLGSRRFGRPADVPNHAYACSARAVRRELR
jgi:hypothetical protein